ncbi:hypothetical protein WJX75_004796 [Coccomyxa subellipsoidea]|uniref:Uncharacterized protein n=1 Tax=Coccomyxa subellipsoidea TaxID=248742 RepID=A0ABR2Z0W6_9CHLO
MKYHAPHTSISNHENNFCLGKGRIRRKRQQQRERDKSPVPPVANDSGLEREYPAGDCDEDPMAEEDIGETGGEATQDSATREPQRQLLNHPQNQTARMRIMSCSMPLKDSSLTEEGIILRKAK